MRVFFKTIFYGLAGIGLAGFGAIVVVSAILLAIALSSVDRGEADLPERIVLDLTLDSELKEHSGGAPLQMLGRRSLSLRQIVGVLDRASRDERVSGLLLRLDNPIMGMAQVQELRGAVRSFRTSGKFAVVFSESYNPTGLGPLNYYLATVFESVWLQPSGGVDLRGINLETPLLRGVLDAIGIEPEFARRGRYKTATENLTERSLSDTHREALNGLAVSWLSQIVAGIVDGRGIAAEEARRLVDEGPYLAEEALRARLVDTLGYWDQVESHVLGLAGDQGDLVSFRQYAANSRDEREVGPSVAVIFGGGPVIGGSVPKAPFSGDEAIGSVSFAEAIRDAAEDDDIKAIVLRIDSPGGSYVASDAIWRAVRQARETGKPVYASMADVAASGGYFIAMGADRVYAQPGTLTGSIGVYTGKFVLADLWQEIGLNWGQVTAGGRAAMWSQNRRFDADEWQKIQESLDAIYADFVAKAAEGRGVSKESIEASAQGRVWTGDEARRRGLVDALGGLPKVLADLAEELQIDANERLRLVEYPRRKSPIDALISFLGGDTETEVAATIARLERLDSVLRRLEPILEVFDGGMARDGIMGDRAGAGAARSGSLRVDPALEGAMARP